TNTADSTNKKNMNCAICTPVSENKIPSADCKMPGHWLLAKMGKRVLRPGGLELTRAMLDGLNIQPRDSVIEFAPGLGVTTRMTLQRRPATYTAIERDENAAAKVQIFCVNRSSVVWLKLLNKPACRMNPAQSFMAKPC
ncbi:MAG: rRNA adenine N-6-methyltransferase family protein, partial [Limisphaerales bacterium]